MVPLGTRRIIEIILLSCGGEKRLLGVTKKRKKVGTVVHAIIVSGFLVCLLGLIALVIGHNTEHSGNISIVHGVLSLDK